MLELLSHPILIAAAVIPAVALLVQVEKADRIEKESRSLLLSLVYYGVVSTALASLTERLGIAILNRIWPEDSLAYNLVLFFVVVGLSEEGFKYLVLKYRSWRSPEFNCQFDGVVYSVFVSLGFALWENISYVLRFGFGTAVVRALTAVPGHACFGVFMGAWYGAAKRLQLAGDEEGSKRMRVFSLLIPALLHGFYDFTATYEQNCGWVFPVFVILMFFAASRLVKKLSREDRYLDGTDG